MENILSEKEIGVLEELVNISFGLSASLVEQMIETPIQLHIPEIDVIDLKDMGAFLENDDSEKLPLYVSKQIFRGTLSGETVFTVPSKDAIKFAKLLYQGDLDVQRAYIEDSLLELTNIMTSSCVGQLTEMLSTKALFIEPHIFLSNENNFISPNELNTYKHVIVMKTVLDLQEVSISGDMFILTSPESFGVLKGLIREMLG